MEIESSWWWLFLRIVDGGLIFTKERITIQWKLLCVWTLEETELFIDDAKINKKQS